MKILPVKIFLMHKGFATTQLEIVTGETVVIIQIEVRYLFFKRKI